MKRLILMRHAKSDWNQGGLTDFERPLNKRGVKNTSNMGKWMAEHIEMPDLILCSAARRTQQTMQLLLLALDLSGTDTSQIEQVILEEMYLASNSTLKSIIKTQFHTNQSIMLIAHNPGMDGVLMHYCPDAPLTTDRKLMTTANIAEIEFDDLFNAELITLQRPADLN